MSPRSSNDLKDNIATALSPAQAQAFREKARTLDTTPSARLRSLVADDLASDARGSQLPTFGETALHMLRASFPSAIGADESAAWLLRTVQETGTGDTAGLLGTYVDPRVVAFIDSRRPSIMSANGGVGQMEMSPKGKTFTIPRITSFPSSAEQTEKSQVSSTQLTTAGDAVTKTTHGEGVMVTEQDIDQADESWFESLKEILAGQNAVSTESAVTAAIEAQVTTNIVGGSVDVTDVDDFVHAVGAAQLAVAGTAGIPGDTLYVGINQLANATAMVGNVTFPGLFPNIVYSPGFSDDFIAVGASRFLRVYEAVKGFVASTGSLGSAQMYGDLVASPATLERTMAYRSYLAVKVYAQALCGIVAS